MLVDRLPLLLVALPPARRRGFTLLELLVVLGVFSIGLTLGLPSLLRATAEHRVRLAGQEVAGVLRAARYYAIRTGTNVGLKFRTAADGTVSYTLYQDGDGDGVRTPDIAAGIDRAAAPPRRLGHFGGTVRFGFPPGITPRHPSPGGGRLDRLGDPIRFNRSDIASFSPLGGATPGSLYLTDGTRHLVAVRVRSHTGLVYVLSYDVETETWSPV